MRPARQKRVNKMTVRPDELASAAADLLGERAYPESQVSYAGVTYWLERADDDVKRLVAVAEDESAFRGFDGTAERIDGGVRFVAETTPENALALRSALPWLTPAPFGLHTSAGFGDRLGLATPGHVRALKEVGAAINPVFAQQSIREMGRCHRTPRDVLDGAGKRVRSRRERAPPKRRAKMRPRRLVVSYVEARRHLPVVRLQRAA